MEVQSRSARYSSARRRLASVFATVIAVLLLSNVIGPAAATPADTPKPPAATFGIGPSDGKKLDQRPYLRYLASPGGKLSDHIAIENFGLEPITLAVYAVDAKNGNDGRIGYLPKASPGTDSAPWFHIATPGGSGHITIASRKSVILPVTLTVPSKATPGDHTAGIVVSVTSRVKGSTGPVNFEQRVALRAAVRVSGHLVARLDIDDLRAHFAGATNVLGRGKVTVRYNVHNSGNVTLGGQQRVQLKGLFGKTGVAPAIVDVPPLLPGGSAEVSVVISKVMAEFLMTARVTVTPLALAGDADPPLTDGTATTKFWAIPWIPLIILILLGLIGAVLIRLRRRRRLNPSRHSTSPESKRTITVGTSP